MSETVSVPAVEDEVNFKISLYLSVISCLLKKLIATREEVRTRE